MQLDDEICLCFHVSKRKLVNFIRVEQVTRPGQLSECFGAGTGCGWCRPYLESLFLQASGTSAGGLDPASDQYVALRQKYICEGGGTRPPDATGGQPVNPL